MIAVEQPITTENKYSGNFFKINPVAIPITHYPLLITHAQKTEIPLPPRFQVDSHAKS